MLVSGDVVRVKLNRALKAGFTARPVLEVPTFYYTQGGLGFGQVWIEFHCLFGEQIMGTDRGELFFKREEAVIPAHLIGEGQASVSQCIIGIDFESLFAALDAALEALSSEFVKVIPGLKIKLIGLRIVSAVFCYRLIARADQLHLKRVHNCTCNLILNRKDFLHFAIERPRPQMIAVSRIDQLGRYAHPVANFAHAAFQNRFDIQLLADLTDVLISPFECKARSSGGHTQSLQLRKGHYQVFCQTVAQVLVLWV